MHLNSEQVHVWLTAVVFTLKSCLRQRVFDIVIFVDNHRTKCQYLAQCDLLMLERLPDVLWTSCDV